MLIWVTIYLRRQKITASLFFFVCVCVMISAAYFPVGLCWYEMSLQDVSVMPRGSLQHAEITALCGKVQVTRTSVSITALNTQHINTCVQS